MFSKLTTLTTAALLSSAIGTVYAADPSHLEHPHSAGTMMFEFQYMRMNMDGILSGTDDRTQASVLESYGAAPKSMSMDMFMLMPMYNITRELSVMLMANFLANDMQMTGHAMKTSGVGDTSVSLSYKFLDDSFAASLETSIPTGDTAVKTDMMHGTQMMNMTAPYAMQLGSGTYDLTPSLAYLGAYYTLRYGAMASYTYRVGTNDSDYALGDKAKFMTWIRKPVAGVTLDAIFTASYTGALEGAHKSIVDKTMSYTADNANYGSTSIADISVGATLPVGPVNVGAKVGMPVYQKLNGIQMKRGWTMTASVAAMF